jgi:hypothetical protein
MERLGIEKVHEAGQGCQAADQPHKDAVTAAHTAIPGSTSMAVQKLEKHEWRRHGPRHITQTAVTQTLQPQETDGHCACANAYSVSSPDGPPRHGSGGFAPGPNSESLSVSDVARGPSRIKHLEQSSPQTAARGRRAPRPQCKGPCKRRALCPSLVRATIGGSDHIECRLSSPQYHRVTTLTTSRR